MRPIILILSLSIILALPKSYGQECWTKVSDRPIDKILSQINNTKTTESDVLFIKQTHYLRNLSHELHKSWDVEYFRLIAKLEELKLNSHRYTMLKTKISNLTRIFNELERNSLSLRETYYQRLESIPTAYLVLVEMEADMAKRTRTDIESKMFDIAKEYLGSWFSPIRIAAKTIFKDSIIIKDLINARANGRVEVFEDNPLRYITKSVSNPSKQVFYIIHKFRIYPILNDTHNYQTDTYKRASNKHKITIIDKNNFKTLSVAGKLKLFQEPLSKMIDEIAYFNRLQDEYFAMVSSEYEELLTSILEKAGNIKKEIESLKNMLQSEFQGKSQNDITHELINIAHTLNSHLKNRETIFVTIKSDFTKEDKLDDVYDRITINAFYDLIERARRLKSYNLFIVENNILKDQHESVTYDDPLPIAFCLPLKMKKLFSEDEGYFRCSVLMGLKVKYSHRNKMSVKSHHIVKLDSGNFKDTINGLEWHISSDEDMTWYEASEWVKKISLNNEGWRMPTVNELKTLFQSEGHSTIGPLAKFNRCSVLCVWSGKTETDLFAIMYNYTYREAKKHPKKYSSCVRALAVRSAYY